MSEYQKPFSYNELQNKNYQFIDKINEQKEIIVELKQQRDELLSACKAVRARYKNGIGDEQYSHAELDEILSKAIYKIENWLP